MSNRLLESDFLNVDLRSILTKQTADASEDNTVRTTADNPTADNNLEDTRETANLDWGEELKKRLKDNRALSAEARQTDYEIESKFFKEFFTANWDHDCAKQLILMGEPLRKALKVLGFNDKVNPILAFLKRPYVQKELIKTKLLNVNTFKAIYNAVAKKLVADSELLRENKYNIIYCKDLYTKPLKDIQNYLELQKQVLKPTANKYTTNDLIKNKKIFLYIEKINEQDPKRRLQQIKKLDPADVPNVTDTEVKLNSTELIETLIDGLGTGISTGTKTIHLGTAEMNKLSDNLDTHAKILAALMSLSMTTDNAEAKKAISNASFGGVSTENLIKATTQIAKFMPKGRVADKDVTALVKILLSKLA